MSDLIDSLNQTFDMETNQMKHDKENFLFNQQLIELLRLLVTNP